jgi:hypothetical protein
MAIVNIKENLIMKTYLRLSLFTLVCLGFALMLVGNTADAQTQEAGLKVLFPEKSDLQLNQQGYVRDTFRVQLTDAEGKKVPDAKINFSVVPAGFATFNPSYDLTDGDGIAETEVTFTSPGYPIVVTGTLDPTTVDTTKYKGIGLLNAFAGHPYRIREAVYQDPDPTTIVVLPPIPCHIDLDLRHPRYLSHLDLALSEISRPHPNAPPESLEDVETHTELLTAINPLRLHGLAARWDDPDPQADPADPTDYDSPPNTFRVPIVILNAHDLAGWQFDIAYNPQILEVIEVSAGDYAIFEGNFLRQGNAVTFFQKGTVQQQFGEIIRISQARIAHGDVNDPDVTPKGHDEWEQEIANRIANDDSIPGANGTGELVSICFRIKEFAEESLGLHNVQLSNSKGRRIDYTTIVHPVVVTHQFPPEDVNRDTEVNVKDLVLVAASLGLAKPINPRADVNNDGIVNVLDLVIVAQHIMDRTPPKKVRDPNMPAPALQANAGGLDPAFIQEWINLAQVEDDGSVIFDLGIANLKTILAYNRPSKTKLLLNYPNPFNPETWIPYQLAEATEVTISIYALNGNLIRTLSLGHRSVGTYHSKSQAAYWDGRNEIGERVASGVYIYTFTAGKFSATGKMLVRK